MKLPFENNSTKIYEKYPFSDNFLKAPKPLSTKDLLQKGIIILDKPPGPTSHMAVDYLKKVLKLKKAGHSGTLDPQVTGALPVALGKATRITHSLLTAGKEYVCLMHLHDDHTDEELNKVLDDFRGEITQLPPKKSAVKRQNRQRTIYYLKILERNQKDVLFLVGCQAGTYIRKLVHDIGLKLGSGAHMTELRRTKAGPFNEKNSHTLQDIADAFYYYNKGDETQLKNMLLPIEKGVDHLKKIWVQDSAVKTLTQGAYLKIPGVVKFSEGILPNELVAVFSRYNQLVLVGHSQMSFDDLKRAKKGVVLTTKQVFLSPEDLN